MARADRRFLKHPLATLVGLLCRTGVLAQTAPPAGSPSDVSYTPVQGLSSPLYPRQDADARPLAALPSAVARIVVEASADGLPADGQSVVA
jgi:hypothetical protein